MFEPDQINENASAKRSVHPEIPPADVRIRQYRTKNLTAPKTKNNNSMNTGNSVDKSKKITESIADTQKQDASLIKQRQGQEHKGGLLTANLGTIYDIPSSMLDESEQTKSTMASTKMMSFSTRDFRKTEGAIFKPPGSDWTNGDESEKVYTTQNKFAGKSNYFSYFPSTELTE